MVLSNTWCSVKINFRKSISAPSVWEVVKCIPSSSSAARWSRQAAITNVSTFKKQIRTWFSGAMCNRLCKFITHTHVDFRGIWRWKCSNNNFEVSLLEEKNDSSKLKIPLESRFTKPFENPTVIRKVAVWKCQHDYRPYKTTLALHFTNQRVSYSFFFLQKWT